MIAQDTQLGEPDSLQELRGDLDFEYATTVGDVPRDDQDVSLLFDGKRLPNQFGWNGATNVKVANRGDTQVGS